VLSHADRARVVRACEPKRLGYLEGANFGSVLIDGFVGATWTVKRTAKTAVLRVAFIEKLPTRERVAVEEEGLRLLAFIAADATSREVTLVQGG
jgi:hypothetical protein